MEQDLLSLTRRAFRSVLAKEVLVQDDAAWISREHNVMKRVERLVNGDSELPLWGSINQLPCPMLLGVHSIATGDDR